IQNAQCASVAGCRSSRTGHKTRADEPVVLDARDKSASVRENCLPVTASARTKSRHLPLTAPPVQPLKKSQLSSCQITPYPSRQFPRNNAPMNLPRSHEKTWRGTQLEEALQGAQRAAHRQAAPFRIEEKKRALAPKRPG